MSREEYQVQLVQAQTELIRAILTYFYSTKEEACMIAVLRLLAMLFRASDVLCN